MACKPMKLDAHRALPWFAAMLMLGAASIVTACGPTEYVNTTTTERVTTQQPVQVTPSSTVTTTRTQRSSP